MITPSFLSIYIFLPIAGSLISMLFPCSFIVFKYFPICALLRSFKNNPVSLLLLKSNDFTNDFDIWFNIFLPSVLEI